MMSGAWKVDPGVSRWNEVLREGGKGRGSIDNDHSLGDEDTLIVHVRFGFFAAYEEGRPNLTFDDITNRNL